jgi:hypothetical protein
MPGGGERHSLRSLAGRITSLAFSPGGGLLAGGGQDGSVRLWDPATGKSRGAVKRQTEAVTAVAFHPDAEHLLSGSQDRTVLRWPPASGAKAAPRGEGAAVPFTPMGKAWREDFYQDFRGNKPLHSALKWMGKDGTEVIEPGEKGLRIKLAASRESRAAVALYVDTPIPGNFEITFGYELLELNPPKNPYGVGVEMYIMTRTEGKEAIAFLAGNRPNKPNMLMASRMTGPDAARRATSRFAPLTAKAGQIGMTRKGREVTAWASTNDAQIPYREVGRFDLGDEDLKLVRVAALPGNPQATLDIRLVDLSIRSDHPAPVLGGNTATGSENVPILAPEGRSTRMLILAVGFTLALIAGIAGFFLLRRRKQHVEEEPELVVLEDEPVAPAIISFACQGCGQRLEAKGGLAGKKVRCPRCSQAVIVGKPRTAAD